MKRYLLLLLCLFFFSCATLKIEEPLDDRSSLAVGQITLKDHAEPDGQGDLSQQCGIPSLGRDKNKKVENHGQEATEEEAENQGHIEGEVEGEERECEEGAHGCHIPMGEIHDTCGTVDEHDSERHKNIQAAIR